MVNICEKFADRKSLVFSTNIDPVKSKTKCIIFAKKKISGVTPILLNGDPLPWVMEVKHLHNSMQIAEELCEQVHCQGQEFHCVGPKTQLLNIYGKSFIGSCLWDLYSQNVYMIYKSWNVTVRKVFSLPWTTHK